MPSRVRLTWNRNQDIETEYYRVFRDDQPNIRHEDSRDKVIMIVQHPKVTNPVTVESELVERESEQTYNLAHKNILIEFQNQSFPFYLEVDGSEVIDFVLDRDEGKIVFDYPIPEESEVRATYTFDGVQVWDYDREEEGKSYYGPEAKDTSPPNPPQNVSLDVETEKNRIILRWSTAQVNGKRLYYRIDAAIDETRFSKLGELKDVFLRESLADRPYIIERSEDGRRWMEIAKVKVNEFYEYAIDRHAPHPVQNLSYRIFLQQNQSEAQVTLSWDPLAGDTSSSTSMYRVRARNKVGVVSEPSHVVGPVEAKVGIKHILIRRKLDDGTIPSYSGTDAETVAVLTDTSVTEYTESVFDNNTYMYGLWVVDQAGNYSSVKFLRVEVQDATPPATPQNITTEEFHIITG